MKKGLDAYDIAEMLVINVHVAIHATKVLLWMEYVMQNYVTIFQHTQQKNDPKPYSKSLFFPL